MPGSAFGPYVAEYVEVTTVSMISVEPITPAIAEWDFQDFVNVVACIRASDVIHAGSEPIMAN